MKSYAWAWLSAALLLGGCALAQAPAPPPQASTVGSAGEAAPPITGLTAGTGSFQNQPVTLKADVTDAMMLDSDRSDDWIMHGRTYDNQRFSPFTQIHAGNVRQLRPSAIIQTGITKSFQMTAIEVDGVLYLEPADNQVKAWDAITGKQLWSYIPTLGYSNLCCGQIARGVAVAYGKVFAAQMDGVVVALDAKPGKPVWKSDKANILPQPAYFYSFTIAPIVFNGLVLVGNAGAEWPTRGCLEALDAKTSL